MNRSAIISIPGNRKKDSSVQVLQVHKGRFHKNQDDEHLPDGIYVCHASLDQTLDAKSWINDKQIDAVIVGPDCLMEDIMAIREIATREVVPLIYHTLKFDWRAREIALESGVDEYHIGFLDYQFIKRILLIRKVKSNSKSNQKCRSEEIVSWKLMALKRAFDILAALLIIFLLSPILLVIIPLLVLETQGSILSSSKRVGRNYKVFDLYKFKSSTWGESKKIDLIRKFLRKAHLVGLPQLLNVLAGDVSFVGNYPVHELDAERFTSDEKARRFSAPVGMTGLWRFDHPTGNKMNAEDHIKADIEYATSNTIWLDIQILFFHVRNLLAAGLHRKEKEWIFSSVKKSIPTFSEQKIFTVAAH